MLLSIRVGGYFQPWVVFLSFVKNIQNCLQSRPSEKKKIFREINWEILVLCRALEFTVKYSLDSSKSDFLFIILTWYNLLD